MPVLITYPISWLGMCPSQHITLYIPHSNNTTITIPSSLISSTQFTMCLQDSLKLTTMCLCSNLISVKLLVPFLLADLKRIKILLWFLLLQLTTPFEMLLLLSPKLPRVCTERQLQVLHLWFKFLLLNISNNMLVTLRFIIHLSLLLPLQQLLRITHMNTPILLMPKYTTLNHWPPQCHLSIKP